MKLLFSFFGFLLIAITVQAQSLTFYPEQPVPGDKVTIKYNPEGTALENISDFETTAFLLEGEIPTAVEIKMKKDGAMYKGTVESTVDTKTMFVSLTSGEDSDNNDGKGHKLKFYNQDKSAKVAGAYASLAQAYGSYYRFMGIDRDREKAMKYLKKEFEHNPTAKADKNYLSLYGTLANQLKDEAAKTEVLNAANGLVQKRKVTEDELSQAYYLYLNLREEEKAEALATKIKKKYKKGTLVQREKVDAFYKAVDLEAKLVIFNDFEAKFGKDEKAKGSLSNMANNISTIYGKAGDWDNFGKYMELVESPLSKASVFNNLAWTMAGGGMDGEATEQEMAQKLSKKSLKLVKGEMESAANKPAYLTKNQWANRLKYSHAMYADTYALTAYRNNDFKEALEYQHIACEANKFEDGEMNERYAIYFEKIEGAEKTMALLDKMIRKGKATPKMKAQHKQLFTANYTIEDAYDKYMVELEKEADAKYLEELKGKMINDPAPAFSLVDLDGQTVSMESLKGKVVVVDFWATWCGPCKASFPGMQQAVNKYKSNSDVVFLFIDTWERGEDKKKLAGDFINEHDYTFRVLLDESSEVVAKFGVEGIPTKFVIDSQGKIRFKSVGYSGNEDELVREISLMIEMAEKSGNKGVVGAD